MAMHSSRDSEEPIFQLQCYLWRLLLFTAFLVLLFYVGIHWPG